MKCLWAVVIIIAREAMTILRVFWNLRKSKGDRNLTILGGGVNAEM